MDINITSQIFVYTNLAAFPVTGADKTLYVADDTEKLYRWTGSVYVEVSTGSAGGVTSFNTRTGAVVSANGDYTTAQLTESTDKKFVTDAQLTVIGNTSGTNTGDSATNTTSNSYADGKVTQVITNGVTDKAPSEDAVFDALALKASLTGTETLTNKTIKKRILVVTQSATPATNIDNADIVQITGLAQAITSMSSSLTGTPYDGQMIMWQITDNGTARAITFGASFAASTGVALPTTTVISTMLTFITLYKLPLAKHEIQFVN